MSNRFRAALCSAIAASLLSGLYWAGATIRSTSKIVARYCPQESNATDRPSAESLTRLDAVGGVLDRLLAPPPTPWSSIGGCGAGAPAGGQSAGVDLMWGKSHFHPGHIELSVVSSSAVADHPRAPGFSTRSPAEGISLQRTSALQFQGTWHIIDDISLSATLPFLWKIHEQGFHTNGIGDLGAGLNVLYGPGDALSSTLTLGFPTGIYDLYREQYILPPEMQLGRGLYSAAFTQRIALAIGHLNVVAGFGYSGGFLGMEATEYDFDKTLSRAVPQATRLSWMREGWGSINDVGAVESDNVSVSGGILIPRRKLTYGFSAAISAPLGESGNYEYTYDFNPSLNTRDYPTKPLAQAQAEDSVAPGFTDPRVVGTDYSGLWVVRLSKYTKEKTPVCLNLQTSLEFGNEDLPLQLLFAIPLTLDGSGKAYSGFSTAFACRFSPF